jgi:transcriptional regulator with XRE-family HTH domain
LIELLVSARQHAGLTQRDLAETLKRPHSFIGRIEAGERRVDVVEFIEIARVLGADAHAILERLIKYEAFSAGNSTAVRIGFAWPASSLRIRTNLSLIPRAAFVLVFVDSCNHLQHDEGFASEHRTLYTPRCRDPCSSVCASHHFPLGQ